MGGEEDPFVRDQRREVDDEHRQQGRREGRSLWDTPPRHSDSGSGPLLLLIAPLLYCAACWGCSSHNIVW